MLYIKGKIFGEGKPLICVPIIADNRKDVLSQCKQARKHGADMIEIRADHFSASGFIDAGLMDEIRTVSRDMIILYTYRTIYEGGKYHYNDNISISDYFSLIEYISENIKPDLIDIEINTDKHDPLFSEKDISALINKIKSNGIYVIGSMHDFKSTPSQDVLESSLEKMNRLGADIFKIAVMPQTDQDVMELMYFSSMYSNKYENPIITISMGSIGSISRIACRTSCSSVTFACIGKTSAPGQIYIDDLKSMIETISPKNIYLTGFMGCGKSSVSKNLAKKMNMEVVDTDELIVEKAGMSINDIFAKYGEAYFRNLETEILVNLSKGKEKIIACGGGIVLKDENVALMKKNGVIILLKADASEILRRVSLNDSRPLLKDNMNEKYILDMLKKRGPMYKKAADIIIGTDNIGVSEVADDIIKYMDTVTQNKKQLKKS